MVTIAANNRDTVSIFVEARITTAYARNSAPIDDTDVISIIPVIGQEVRFL